MIYGKMWCVVKPSVGLPLIIGAVAVSSFAVHYALLTHTTWLPKYYEGGKGAAAVKAAAVPAATLVAAAPAPAQK